MPSATSSTCARWWARSPSATSTRSWTGCSSRYDARWGLRSEMILLSSWRSIEEWDRSKTSQPFRVAADEAGWGRLRRACGGAWGDWADRAPCSSAEPEQFCPVGGAAAARWETTAAKQVCARCAVITECRDYALVTRQPFGVWGGLDEEERRAVLAQGPMAVTAGS